MLHNVENCIESIQMHPVIAKITVGYSLLFDNIRTLTRYVDIWMRSSTYASHIQSSKHFCILYHISFSIASNLLLQCRKIGEEKRMVAQTMVIEAMVMGFRTEEATIEVMKDRPLFVIGKEGCL